MIIVFILFPIIEEIVRLNEAGKVITLEDFVGFEQEINFAKVFLFGYGIVNLFLMFTRAQTIGKTIFGLQVVKVDGVQVSGWRYLGLRVIPIGILNSLSRIGGLFWLVDVLLIFRPERNCLHDDIAGTRVVYMATNQVEKDPHDEW